jgi:2,5-diamino-6-(ribosylamino)-4(3H)-pyrimidinone 5'-phosphate reductase
VNYLKERNYDYLACGDEHIDFEKAFSTLSAKYDINTIVIDSGPTLNEVLLSKSLIDEISLLVSPVLVGGKSDKLLTLLNNGNTNINLKYLACEDVEGEFVLLRYKVLKQNSSH